MRETFWENEFFVFFFFFFVFFFFFFFSRTITISAARPLSALKKTK